MTRRKVSNGFRESYPDKWDRQIEEDIKTGKLDKLAEEALAADFYSLQKRMAGKARRKSIFAEKDVARIVFKDR